MYCSIQNKIIGNKLDNMFDERNRNQMSNILDTPEFKSWFGEGRKDVEGNPVIDETASFTNSKGEKKTVFDFEPINFDGRTEVRKFLKASPGIHQYNGELFINNTKKTDTGEFVAEKAMKLYNTVNFYYPGLLNIQIYKREGRSQYSKDEDIPLPIIRVNDNVPLQKLSGLFSIHDLNKLNQGQDQFKQLAPTRELESIKNALDEVRAYGLNAEDMETLANLPEVSKQTYDRLTEFVKKINPDFRIETIDDLGANGIAYINDFLIKVDSNAKFKAMPEEVAHFFVELLPRNSPLRKELIDNVVNFSIYGTTLAAYKGEYLTPSGSIDYDAIKREAAAKLISEYITAIDSGDTSRLEKLTKVKGNWITKWWNKLVDFFRGAKGTHKADKLSAYVEAANAILEGDTDYISVEEINDKARRNVFFQTGDMNKIDMAKNILRDVSTAGKLEDLQQVIDDFRKELRINFLKIVKDKGFDKINAELKKDSKGETTDINYLSQLYDTISSLDITGKDLQNMMVADSQVVNFSEFIDIINNLDRVAKAINTILDASKAGKYELSIEELNSFRRVYSTFTSLIDTNLTGVLVDSGVSFDIVNSLKSTSTQFDTIESNVLKLLRNKYSTLIKGRLAKQNDDILNSIVTDLDRILGNKVKDKQTFEDAFKTFKADIKAGKSFKDARSAFNAKLAKDLTKADLESPVVTNIFERLDRVYTTDKAVEDLLAGTGTDIDLTSQGAHLITAGIKNKDPFVSNIAKYIVDKRGEADNAAQIAIRGYLAAVNPTVSALKKLGMDEYDMGEAITYIDQVPDKNNKDGVRSIVKFLNPVRNDIILEKEKLFEAKNKLRAEWKNDKNALTAKNKKNEFLKARRQYLNFLDDHFNSPYKKELRDFYKKWNSDEDFLDYKEEWDILGEQIRDLRSLSEDEHNPGKDQAYEEMLLTMSKQKDLIKEKDKEGNLKPAEDLKLVRMLKQFFDESNSFREEDTIRTERNFNLARNNYEAKIDYALDVFAKTGSTDLDNLERVLQNEMKDPSIRIKYRYMFESGDIEGVSSTNVKTDAEFNLVKDILLSEFDIKNRVKVKNKLYFELQQDLSESIAALKAKQGVSRRDLLIDELSRQINDIVSDRKDEYGERNPIMLTREELNKVTQLENKLASLQQYNVSIYKILPEVIASIKDIRYKGIIEDYEKASKQLDDYLLGDIPFNAVEVERLKKEINEVNEIFKASGFLSKEQLDVSAQLREKFADIRALSERKPTTSYWEQMEDVLPLLDAILEDNFQKSAQPKNKADKIRADREIANLQHLSKGLRTAIYEQNHELLDMIINDEYFVDGGMTPVDFTKYLDVNILTDSSIIDEIDPDFSKWFVLAHKPGAVYVKDEGLFGEEVTTRSRRERQYTRRLFYVQNEPTDERLYDVKYAKRYRATKIKGDINGKTEAELGFYQKQVTWRDSDDMEDWTVSNRDLRHEFMPLSRKQLRAEGKTGDKYDKYLNSSFYTMKDSKDQKDKLLFKYLNTSIKTYLEEQSTKPDDIKGMYNLPVTMLDSFQRDEAVVKNLPDRLKRIGQGVASFFKKNEAIDAEEQLTDVSQKQDVNEQTQDIIQTGRPMLGMNVKLPVERVNRNVIHAMEMYIYRSKDFDTRADLSPFVSGLVDVMKQNEKNQRTQNQKKRADIFDQIYRQMILEEMPDNITNKPQFRKFANIIMTMTGLKLAGDLVGGSVNYVQANLNNLIESFAGKHVTMGNYREGYAKATRMMGDFASDYTKKTDFGFWTMMYQHFQFIQGDWIEDLTERSSVKGKAFDWRKMLMYPRKLGELHAQSALGIAVLDNTKVVNKIDGKSYPVWDIYKKEGDNLVLKEGFYELNDDGTKSYPWNPVDGENFKKIKQKIWDINIDLHGNYAKVNQTEASRHSIGKLTENMKRWFIPAFQRRFGREHYDVSTETLERGYYRTAWNFLRNTLRNVHRLQRAGEWYRYYTATPKERYNLRRTVADITGSLLLFLISSFAFGYDDDDKNRNKKLKKESWLYNIALVITVRSYAEQTSFIPVPPFGFTELGRNLLDPFSVAKSSITNVVALAATTVFTVGYYMGIEDLKNETLYSKDTGGRFAQKGDLKLVNYFLKTIGYNGSQVDPQYYLKNFEQLQNRLK